MSTEDRPHRPAPFEAYSRITDPERFRPLIATALQICAQLRSAYEVRESPAFVAPAGLLAPFDHARPPLTLSPIDPAAAELRVAFTALPGLIVSTGRWHIVTFPSCACDACAETAATEIDRFRELVGHVVAGRFSEKLVLPLLGGARLHYSLDRPSAIQSSEGWSAISRPLARQLLRGGPPSVSWRPWEPRSGFAPGLPPLAP